MGVPTRRVIPAKRQVNIFTITTLKNRYDVLVEVETDNGLHVAGLCGKHFKTHTLADLLFELQNHVDTQDAMDYRLCYLVHMTPGIHGRLVTQDLFVAPFPGPIRLSRPAVQTPDGQIIMERALAVPFNVGAGDLVVLHTPENFRRIQRMQEARTRLLQQHELAREDLRAFDEFWNQCTNTNINPTVPEPPRNRRGGRGPRRAA